MTAAFMIAAAPYLAGASAAITGISAIQQGVAARRAGKHNALVAEQNAVLARQEANSLAEQQDRENFLRLGAIRASQGKSGGSGGEGSVLDIIGDVAAQGELQRQYILRAGEIKAAGYSSTATLDRASGRAAQTAGYMRAGSALLEGGVDYAVLKRD
jgi:hypothetical protein